MNLPQPPDPPESPPTEVTEILRATPPHGFPDEDKLDDQLAALVSHSRRYLWTVIAILSVMVVGLVGAVIYLIASNQNATEQVAAQVAAAQAASDHRWCATMQLLTATPVTPPANPAANPSREASYQLYLDFLTLKNQFHC